MTKQKALTILHDNRQLQKSVIEKYHGKWIKELGDGILASFPTATDAVLSASEIQNTSNANNEFKLRIGIHLGEVIYENNDVFGEGVNIASRLQSVAPVGGIWVSETVQRNVSNKKEIVTKFVREEALKNVKDIVRIYEVLTNEPALHSDAIQSASTLFPGNSIAVLPFVNMSKDPEQEFFSDGISEEIINTLAQIPGLKVPGRTSSFTFKGKNEDLRSIGEKLSVNAVLEGSVRSSGNRIRISAQLISTRDGYQLWSEKFDRVLNDVFEVQEEIAAAIVKKLQVSLNGKPAEPRIREQTASIEAYKYYLKGRALAYKRGRFIFEAKTLFERALEIDPEYALAHAGLADAYSMICYYGLLEPDNIWPLAKQNAELAMKFGPELAETQTCNAVIALIHDWDFEKANQFYLKALELNPGYEQARTWYGYFYLQCARSKHEEGIKNCRMALVSHPLSTYSHTILALSLAMAGHYEESLEIISKGIEIDPESFLGQLTLAAAYAVLGEYESAMKTYDIAFTLSNQHSWALAFSAVVYTFWKKMETARKIYDELRARKTYIQPSLLAMVAAALGDNGEAMQLAQSGLEKHDPFFIFCEGQRLSDPLRKLAGYDDLRKKAGLIG